MKRSMQKSTIETAAAQLRKIVLATKEGALVGSEEALTDRLGVSRATVRQVARLLEREGLLRVRRGIKGGYFAARPDAHTIEATVSAYLEMFDTNLEDVFAIASVLWVEVMRKAAAKSSSAAKRLATSFRKKVTELPSNAPYEDILQLEMEIRSAIFTLINSHYIQLIFQINAAFAQRKASPISDQSADSPTHREFVHAWRNAVLMELEAIAAGDQELGMIAARHVRNLWHKRMVSRILS